MLIEHCLDVVLEARLNTQQESGGVMDNSLRVLALDSKSCSRLLNSPQKSPPPGMSGVLCAGEDVARVLRACSTPVVGISTFTNCAHT